MIYLHGAHGGMWEGENMGWTTKASKMAFVVAYPQALANNAGITSWNLYFNHSFTKPPDDVGFIKSLILAVELGLAVDHRKVFVTGFSLGAFMTNRVGVELGDMVAAIAPVSGELWEDVGGPVPREVAPVSVLMLNGSADTSVPYCGMTTPYPEASEDDTFNYWQTQNVCKPSTAALCSGGKPSTTSSKTATGLLLFGGGAAVRTDRRHAQVVHRQHECATGNLHPALQLEIHHQHGTDDERHHLGFFRRSYQAVVRKLREEPETHASRGMGLRALQSCPCWNRPTRASTASLPSCVSTNIR